MIVSNNNGEVVVEMLTVADGFFSRLRGLMFTDSLPDGAGILLTPCNSVHTFFMRYPIDVIFLDENYAVIRIISAMKKNSISPIVKGARHVLEVPAKKAASMGLAEGTQLELKDC